MVKLTGVDITFASDFRRRGRCRRKSWLRHALNIRKSRIKINIELLVKQNILTLDYQDWGRFY